VIISEGDRQGCSLSLELFNICTDDLIREWKTKVNPEIYINQNKMLNVRLFANDQMVIQTREEELQR
jgi:hypothetical protein